MDINFKIAPIDAIKLYLAGMVMGHAGFAPIDNKTAKRIKKYIKVSKIPHFGEYADYSDFKSVKKAILSGLLISPVMQTELDSINFLGKINYADVNDQIKWLDEMWLKNKASIEKYIEKETDFRVPDTLQNFTVYLMPYFDESAESMGDVLVIGTGIEKEVAFGILLEEMLHSLIKIKPQDSEVTNGDEDLLGEVIVGVHLFKLLSKLNYNQKIIDSLVFEWQNGKREKMVKQILNP